MFMRVGFDDKWRGHGLLFSQVVCRFQGRKLL